MRQFGGELRGGGAGRSRAGGALRGDSGGGDDAELRRDGDGPADDRNSAERDYPAAGGRFSLHAGGDADDAPRHRGGQGGGGGRSGLRLPAGGRDDRRGTERGADGGGGRPLNHVPPGFRRLPRPVRGAGGDHRAGVRPDSDLGTGGQRAGGLGIDCRAGAPGAGADYYYAGLRGERIECGGFGAGDGCRRVPHVGAATGRGGNGVPQRAGLDGRDGDGRGVCAGYHGSGAGGPVDRGVAACMS